MVRCFVSRVLWRNTAPPTNNCPSSKQHESRNNDSAHVRVGFVAAVVVGAVSLCVDQRRVVLRIRVRPDVDTLVRHTRRNVDLTRIRIAIEASEIHDVVAAKQVSQPVSVVAHWQSNETVEHRLIVRPNGCAGTIRVVKNVHPSIRRDAASSRTRRRRQRQRRRQRRGEHEQAQEIKRKSHRRGGERSVRVWVVHFSELGKTIFCTGTLHKWHTLWLLRWWWSPCSARVRCPWWPSASSSFSGGWWWTRCGDFVMQKFDLPVLEGTTELNAMK